ncbi:MAG: D-alanyl-D-alanine carboxypeptidase/D-alanyl-D-alanine-endopeptidase [Rhodothermaceae bacterium]|nr:D-alanyl-D-alanine carboxypeptidase/D-alanyl-D-alanine-endopeptidase [Rhodothermaceae bacterium]MBC11987.1 D-alanyl-D-alanine carboxypeptidase/D-alanyl-D-alanine-endopeptidase [Rhodothermaceae bacterium]
MRRLCLTAVAVVLASLSALAQPTYDRWALADSIDAVLGERAFGPAHWGAHVVDLETGEVYYSRDAYASFIPASNMKLLTTAAALDVLGPDHRFVTRLSGAGTVAFGTLDGPLVVRGVGDPAFAGSRYRTELRGVFQAWADSLRERRIRAIFGPILVTDAAVPDPDSRFVRALLTALEDADIQVVDRTVRVVPPEALPDEGMLVPLASYSSPPLASIVRTTNEDSDNLYAERLLWVATAAAYPGAGPPPSNLRSAAIGSFLRRIDIDPQMAVVADGSGLSRQNRLTPSGTVDLLTVMWTHPSRATQEAFVGSLPVGGITGTLERRYRIGDARGNVRAKTGFINGVRTLSGYVTTASGRELAFSLMCNGYTVRTSRINWAQDTVVELLADFRGRPVGG